MRQWMTKVFSMVLPYTTPLELFTVKRPGRPWYGNTMDNTFYTRKHQKLNEAREFLIQSQDSLLVAYTFEVRAPNGNPAELDAILDALQAVKTAIAALMSAVEPLAESENL